MGLTNNNLIKIGYICHLIDMNGCLACGCYHNNNNWK